MECRTASGSVPHHDHFDGDGHRDPVLEPGVDLLDDHHHGDGEEPGNQVGHVGVSDIEDDVVQGLGGQGGGQGTNDDRMSRDPKGLWGRS